MFEDLLPDNLNSKLVLFKQIFNVTFSDSLIYRVILVFVTTAANAHEHSYACYFDSERGYIYYFSYLSTIETKLIFF